MSFLATGVRCTILRPSHATPLICTPKGQISPYKDNQPNIFGVEDVGLPDGCQVEQAHTLQRHADRLPGDWSDDGPNSERFAEKVANHTKSSSGRGFTGPLAFLNSY